MAEIIDLGLDYYTREEYDACLHLLGRVNRLLGGFRATEKAFKDLKFSPASILDVGCGGGDLCRRLHEVYPAAKITGIDISSWAVEYSLRKLPPKNVTFIQQKDKTLDFPDNSFDVVTTMLVCHHMSDEELVTFLKESYRVCSSAVVINDLHRHILAYLGFSMIAPVAFPNRLIWHDGRLSVRRSFRKGDWIILLEKAGIDKSQYVLKWHTMFRWTLTLIKPRNDT